MTLNRRHLLAGLASAAACAGLPAAWAQVPPPLNTKAVPSSGETIPRVGLGSWITFNVGANPAGLARSADVMEAFFAAGGRMIDSSPMYGSSQATIGHGLKALGKPENLFACDKVWTASRADLQPQLQETAAHWGIGRFNVLYVHNLLNWEAHLPALFDMKVRGGAVQYVGVTTSHGRRHRELEHIMESQPLDFVQLTYNLANREAEARLLPLAAERGIAVVANRPYDGGDLIRRLKRDPLPAWAKGEGMGTWADVALKYILAHPGLTAAIPATTRVEHVQENMGASRGPMPDASLLKRMAAYVDDL